MDPWDDPHNPYRRHRRSDSAPWFDTMQVCENGHQITSFARSQPESQKRCCPDCGAPTLMACRKCGEQIPGHHHFPDGVSIGIDPVPAFCESCGQPYPWTRRKDPVAVGDIQHADLDAILADAQVDAQQNKTRENWGAIWPSLFHSSNAAAGFLAEMIERDLGRPPTPEEVASRWVQPFLLFGRRIVECGGTTWPEELPGGTPEKDCAKGLLKLACCTVEDSELISRLAKLHDLGRSNHVFYSGVRDALRRCFDILMNRASESFGPASNQSHHEQARPSEDSDISERSRDCTMTEPGHEMEEIRRAIASQRQREEELSKLYEEQQTQWRGVRDAFYRAAFLTISEVTSRIGRPATDDEFYTAWAEQLATMGQIIREKELLELLSEGFKPDSLEGKWVRGLLLRACHTPTDITYLRDRLREAGEEPRLHVVRDWIWKAVRPLLEAIAPRPAELLQQSGETTTENAELSASTPSPARRSRESVPDAGDGEKLPPEGGGMKCCFGWLHLTDLHLGMPGQKWLWPNMRQAFFDDLKQLHEKAGPWDLVLFTGDFVQKGEVNEYQQLNELLDQLWKLLRGLGSNPALLAVPGNHDLKRPSPAAPAIAALRTGWEDKHVQDEFWKNQKSGYRKAIQKAFKNYLDWWAGHPLPRTDRHHPGLLPGDFSATFEKGGCKLGIVGLNSTFLQLEGGDYTERLAVSPQQFHEACGGDGAAWARQHHAAILLTHQPPSWLRPKSRGELYGEIAVPGRFAAHLFGHMHEPAAHSVSVAGAEARREWQGCSLFGLEEWGEAGNKKQRLHGYSAGRIEIEGAKGFIRQWPRKAVPHQAGHLHLAADVSFSLEPDEGTPPDYLRLHGSTDTTTAEDRKLSHAGLQSVCITDHNNTIERINLDQCHRYGHPIVPNWINATPERMSSDWLVNKFSRKAKLQLFFDPRWSGGTWFVADLESGDGVVINPHQLAEIKPPSPTTTTTPAPQSFSEG